jgi:hypothetical protein
MLRFLIYQLPTDNKSPVSVGGTWAVNEGAEDLNYPAANLGDLKPSVPAKLNSSAGAWVRDFGSAQALDLVALIHHNFDTGLNVRVQANASNAWTAPSLDVGITIPAADADGFTVNPWVDLTTVTPRSYRYWRISVPENSVNLQLGEVWLGATLRTLIDPIPLGMVDTRSRPAIQHETDFGVETIYDLGVKIRHLNVDYEPSPAGRAQIIQWWDACHGRSLPTLIVRDPDENVAFMMRWDINDLAEERQHRWRSGISLSWKEVSRGLPL